MNPQPSPVLLFSTNENKSLLWSVLHGSGKFTGIPDSEIHVIKQMFEQTIYEISEHHRTSNQSVNLNAINKEAVMIICKKMENIKRSQQQTFHNHHFKQINEKKQQIPQLETIYKAEDIHRERQNFFQNELKKKEEEMSSVLKLKKPEQIDFTDEIYDKPIGNDMERLLAEALASRERELEQIKNVSFHSPQSDSFVNLKDNNTNNNNNMEGNKNKEIEKRVHFENELQIIHSNQHEVYENNETVSNKSDEDEDVKFIFNKLKKIKTKRNEYNNSNANRDIHDDVIFQMSEDIKYIKGTLTELLNKISK